MKRQSIRGLSDAGRRIRCNVCLIRQEIATYTILACVRVTQSFCTLWTSHTFMYISPKTTFIGGTNVVVVWWLWYVFFARLTFRIVWFCVCSCVRRPHCLFRLSWWIALKTLPQLRLILTPHWMCQATLCFNRGACDRYQSVPWAPIYKMTIKKTLNSQLQEKNGGNLCAAARWSRTLSHCASLLSSRCFLKETKSHFDACRSLYVNLENPDVI